MTTGIHVGNSIDKESSDNLKSIITEVFTVGSETRMDQSTIQEALRLVATVTEVKQVSIESCVIKGDNVVNMSDEDKKY